MQNLLKHRISVKRPYYLPVELGRRAIKFAFRYSKAERNVYRKRKRIPVSEWVERHRVITMGAVLGPWRNSTTPYLAGIMDASFFPTVETVIICAADQVGKSECVNNCVGYAIDRAPGPVLYVYPDEQTAKENSRDRILPMIQSSRRLKSYMSSTQDDAAAMRINLQHMPIYMAWAHSASRLANKPIRYVVFDETDKYPESAGKREASPIRKGEKRLRTYRHYRKVWKLSTPTIEPGPIWQALTTEAEAVFDYHVKCPECGELQRMVFDQIKWPADTRDPQKVEREDLARYECIKCGASWDDHLRNLAVQEGQWIARSGEKLAEYLRHYEPKRIGFHIPSWLSRFVGLSEVAASFLKGLVDKNELKDFLNSHAAEPWKSYSAEREEERILELCDDRPRGLVPGNDQVSCLTAGVDTQDAGFWFEIRAWGWGMTLESWQIREGYVDSFEALAQLLFEDMYLDNYGKGYPLRLVVQDAMGHRTSEVYDFARSFRGRLLAFKGEQRMRQPHAFSNLEHYPRTQKPIPGGLKLLRADVNFFKNQLAGKLEVAAGDPGAWHLHSETTEEWARHLCAEYIDDKTGLWACPENRANHGWDCSVYNLVAANVLGVKFWKKETQPRQSDQKPSGWIRGRGGWINRG